MRDIASVSDKPRVVAMDWGLVATTCEFLAFSFRYPNYESVLPIVSGEWFGAFCDLRHAWVLPDDSEIKALMQLGGSEEDVLSMLRQEATRLFIGPPSPTVSPYESVWTASRTHTAPLLFVSPSALAVERFCAACGLGRPDGTNESLDHISTELELLQFLASIEAGLLDAASCGIDPVSFPGGSPISAFACFFEDHLAKWACDFATDLEGSSRHVFYRASARLLRDFTAVLQS